MSFTVVHDTMTVLTWRDRLEVAQSERDVVGVVKDYIAQFDRFDIWQLSEDCRPGKFVTAEDVMTYAFTLARQACREDPDVEGLVLKLAAFFSQASFRLSQVMARTNDEEPGSRRSA
jgi:hypothetical protein